MATQPAPTFKIKKYHAATFIVNMNNSPIMLPGKSNQAQQSITMGVVKWPVEIWSTQEHTNVGIAIQRAVFKSSGKTLSVTTEAVFDAVAEELPDREFVVNLDAYIMEKIETKPAFVPKF